MFLPPLWTSKRYSLFTFQHFSISMYVFFVQTIDYFVSSYIFFPGQVNIIWQQKSEDRLMVVVRFWLHLPPFPIHMCSLLKYHQQSPHLQTSFNKCLLPVPYVGYICFLPRDEERTVIKYLLGILVTPETPVKYIIWTSSLTWMFPLSKYDQHVKCVIYLVFKIFAQYLV